MDERRGSGQLRQGRGGVRPACEDASIPQDPWSHPEAERLDRLSIGDWLREAGATRNAVRARDLFALALSSESIERTSLLSELRKEASADAGGFYSYETWEAERVAEGSATVPLRMAEELGHRVRYATPVSLIRVSGSGCSVTAATGERFEAEVVVSAVPAGPLRDIQVEGVSAERLGSLHRQRHALAAKPVFAYESAFWEEEGQNGDLYSETGLIGGAWAQAGGRDLDPGAARAPGAADRHPGPPGQPRS